MRNSGDKPPALLYGWALPETESALTRLDVLEKNRLMLNSSEHGRSYHSTKAEARIIENEYQSLINIGLTQKVEKEVRLGVI